MAGSIVLSDSWPQDAGGRFAVAPLYNPATSHVLLRRALGGITEGSAGAAGYGDAGIVLVDSTGANAITAAAAEADGETNPTVSGIAVYNKRYNGSTWDRWYNNANLTLLASAAHTTTQTSSTQTNWNAAGVLLHLSITAAPNTAETLTLQLGFTDPLSGNAGAIVASIVTAAGSALQSGPYVYRLLVTPGASGTPDDAKSKAYALPVGRRFFGQVTPSGASSWTYSLSVDYLA